MRYLLAATLLIFSLRADYLDITLNEYADIVSKIAKKNIVLDQELDSKMNIYISQEISEIQSFNILRLTLENQGYMLVDHKDFYLLTKKKIDKVEIYRLQYIEAEDIIDGLGDTLASFFQETRESKKEKGLIQQASESFLGSEGEEGVEKSKKDEQKGSTSVDSQYFSVNAIDKKTIALTFQDPKIERIAAQIIKEVDIERKRIKVLSKIYEVSTDDLQNFGMNFGISGRLKESANIGWNVLANLNPISAAAAAPTFTQNNQIIFNGLIDFLENNSSSKFISAPHVSLLEGKEAKYHDGQTYPITKEQTQTESTYSQTSTEYEYIDIGLSFEIDFEKYQSGFIYFDLKLHSTNVVDYRENQIITNSRSIETYLKVAPGEKIVLAGLNKENIKNVVYGVPILKDIPIINALFKREEKEISNTSIVMTLEILEV